jgi:hypothetical protein
VRWTAGGKNWELGTLGAYWLICERKREMKMGGKGERKRNKKN